MFIVRSEELENSTFICSNWRMLFIQLTLAILPLLILPGQRVPLDKKIIFNESR